ncbi:MAG: TrgA family protein [Roseinatronobacter sp.]
MPTLTRLAALLIFAALTYVLGMRYQLMLDPPPQNQRGALFLAAIAGFVGWHYVGPRIDASYLRGLSVVVQGYIATALLALFLFGFYDAFTQGYRMRYRTLGDAAQGAIRSAIDLLGHLLDRDFLTLVAVMTVVIAGLVTTVFRIAEARRRGL